MAGKAALLQELGKPGDSFQRPIGILEAEVVRAAEEVEAPVSRDPSFAPQSCDERPMMECCISTRLSTPGESSQ
jgi:hypothetical protein